MNVETILKRAYVNGLSMSKVNSALTVFGGAARIEDVHPMQFGLGRRKVRTQRRHGMPIVNPLIFYPWRAYDFTKGAYAWISLFIRHRRMRKRIQHDPRSADYIDESLRVTTEGAANRVVWNPWVEEAAKLDDVRDEWTSFVCVEGGNVLGNAVTVAPGESRSMTYRVEVLGR